MNFPNLMRDSRIKQNPLRDRGLAGIYMGNNTYIPCFLYRIYSRHGFSSAPEVRKSSVCPTLEQNQVQYYCAWQSTVQDCIAPNWLLPREVSEGAICLSHPVRVFFLFYCPASILCSFNHFFSQFFSHRFSLSGLCSFNNPAHS